VENAVALRRAALCGFLISGAALIRVIFCMLYYASLRPLASYNTLFVPLFAMFGLLCLVMSALFRQAAELKADGSENVYVVTCFSDRDKILSQVVKEA